MDGHSIVNLLLVVIGFAIFPDYRPEMLIQPMGFKQQSAILCRFSSVGRAGRKYDRAQVRVLQAASVHSQTVTVRFRHCSKKKTCCPSKRSGFYAE